MKISHLHEAQYSAHERWIHEDRMDDLIKATCFNGYGSVGDFWMFYHQALLPVGKKLDDDYAYKFLSDIKFRRKQHVRSMNETLNKWDARFRVSDMRWIGEDEDAPMEWKVVGKIPEQDINEARYHGLKWVTWLEAKIANHEEGNLEIPENDLMDVYHYMTNKYGQGMMLQDEDIYFWDVGDTHEVAVNADGQLWVSLR